MYVKEHPPPHIHAVYGADVGLVDTATGDIIDGALPRNAARLVKEWVLLHRAELEYNWARIEEGLPPHKIEALDAGKS